MQKKKFLLILCFTFCTATILMAQKKSSKDGVKIDQLLESADEQINKLLNNKNKSSNTEKAGTKKVADEKVEDVGKSTPKSGMNPGDLHPNAKVIEAEELYPFNCGAAIVRKGTATALIDSHGNYIINYADGKLPLTIPTYGINDRRWQNGIFKVAGPVHGAVNSKGKVINDKIVAESYSKDGLYLIEQLSNYGKGFQMIDKSGKLFVFSSNMENISEGYGTVLIPKEGKYAYKNLSDQFISKTYYDEVHPFSNGMALVGKRNEFGELKYGFIDTKGKEAIPLQYSIMPSDFQGGLALVKPKDQSTTRYAYINKKGDIVKSFTSQDEAQTGGGNFLYGGNGYYCNSRYMMDSLGNIQSVDDFLAGYGIRKKDNEDKKPSLWLADVNLDFNDQKFMFMRPTKNKKYPGAVGFIDLKTGKVVEAVFHLDQKGFGFDAVSGLAHVKLITGYNGNGFAIFRDGYINRDGIFMIVVGESSKW